MAGVDRLLTNQFIRFCLVGSVGTAVHYSALVAIAHFQGKPILGSAVGFVLGAMVNYVLNYRYTFQSASRHHETLAKFFATACAGLVLNTLVMGVLTGLLGVHYFVSQLLATAGVVLWNFTVNRRWTFHRG
ncbi:MAG: GtrA family protein [Nitrospira sp.]|nr:MAG: GtrA family protein [Nitrospira sp.]